MIKLVKSIVSTIIVFIFMTFTVHAEEQTTSALIALYDNSIYVPSQEELNELHRQLNEYNSLLNRNKIIKEYNSAIDDAEEYKNMLMEEVNIQLSEVLNDAIVCTDNIADSIYGDIDTLIKYDSEYKVHIRKANSLMDEINKYSLTTKLATLDTDLAEKQIKIDEMQEELTMPDIQVVEGEFLLGEVYNCKSPAVQEYKVNSNWGARLSPMTGTSIEYHNGIDLYAPEGTDVLSIFNGRVLEAGENWALGTYVRIQHGPGVISVYGHLSSTSVKCGDYVKQYQKIGESGNTGKRTTGAHLHFGLFINGRSVDPGILLRNAS